MAIDKFAIFILTHGRPDRVITYKTLRKQGYTGDIWIIVDNEDKTIEEYRKNYGDKAIVFDKLAISKTFDEGDNFNDRRAIIYARNACFQIAKDLGLEYFLQLDDDYKYFCFKFSKELIYHERQGKALDKVFSVMLDYYKSIPAMSISFSQNGDFIGGGDSTYAEKVGIKRKVMNSFFCDINRGFNFIGRINEDVNTYATLGNRGLLFFQVNLFSLYQISTQQNKGGMSDLYKLQGTYIKSFYTVMYAPSCTKIAYINSKRPRIHHKIKWDDAVPKIVSEELKRKSV